MQWNSSGVRWAAGMYCVMVGTLALVAPHQFDRPVYVAFQPYLAGWGVLLLLAGAGMLLQDVLPLRCSVRAAAHALCGGALGGLAVGFAIVGAWTGTSMYGVTGLAVALAPFLGGRAAGGVVVRELLPIVAGIALLLTGGIILLLPAEFDASVYDAARPYLGVHGLAFLAAGIALVATRVPRSATWGAARAADAVAAVACLAFAAAVAVPTGAVTGTVFYVGLALSLLGLPHLRRHGLEPDPTSLQMRLAVALAVAAVLPLLGVVAVGSRHQEQVSQELALDQQRAIAVAVADHVERYVGLHRAAVAALAGQPGILDESAEQQRGRLRAAAAAYPDVVAFSTYRADGSPIARSDDLPPTNLSPFRFYQQARQTNAPSHEVLVSPLLQRPIFAFAHPVRGTDGAFVGAVAASLEATRAAEALGRAGAGTDRTAYVVDEGGRVLATSDPAVPALSDAAVRPPVAAFRGSRVGDGSIVYGPAGAERLASFALIGETGWAVIVERPMATVLAGVLDGQNLAAVMLILAIVAATLAGIAVARRLSAPLAQLARATAQLAGADLAVPLPASGVRELRALADAFARSRAQLAARTAERDRLYEAERRARAQAENAVRTRDAVVEAVVHDLKNPLAAIRGHAQLARRRLARTGSVEGLDRSVAHIEATASTMTAMVAELLDLARLESGEELALQLEPTDLVALAERAVVTQQATTDRHTFRLDAEAPEVTGVWDAARLARVLSNLLGNAVKYSPDGGEVVVRVGVERAAQGARAVLEVRDQGIGIPAADLERVFDRFHRAENARDRATGSGIGLATVRHVVEQHGGTVSVASSEGAGSIFTARLPMA
jgi:signal transduction histidine kinase